MPSSVKSGFSNTSSAYSVSGCGPKPKDALLKVCTKFNSNTYDIINPKTAANLKLH